MHQSGLYVRCGRATCMCKNMQNYFNETCKNYCRPLKSQCYMYMVFWYHFLHRPTEAFLTCRLCTPDSHLCSRVGRNQYTFHTVCCCVYERVQYDPWHLIRTQVDSVECFQHSGGFKGERKVQTHSPLAASNVFLRTYLHKSINNSGMQQQQQPGTVTHFGGQ